VVIPESLNEKKKALCVEDLNFSIQLILHDLFGHAELEPSSQGCKIQRMQGCTHKSACMQENSCNQAQLRLVEI